MVDSENTYGERVSRLVSWGHWFAFFNIIAAMLIGTRYITQSPWPETLLGQSYLAISWVGHFSFLIFAIYILVLFPITFILPSRKLFRLFSVCVATVGLTALLLDTQVYQEMHLHINPVIWELITSKQGNIETQWQQLFVVVPIIFLLELGISEWVWRKKRRLAHKHIGRPLAGLLFSCFVASHLIYVWADAYFYGPITSQRANFPLSYPMTAKSFMARHGFLERDAYLERLENYSGQTKLVNYPIEPLQYNSRGDRYNVLLVMLDNLRASSVNQEDTPNLYQYAQNNQYFTNHYSASNDMYGVFGLFYGLPSNYADSVKAQGETPLVLTELQGKGYQFGLFSGDNFEDDLYHETIFRTLKPQPLIEGQTPSDRNAIDSWKAWVDQNPDEPWFSFIELNTVAEYESLQVSDDVKDLNPADRIMASYKKSTLQVDELVAEVISHLTEHQLNENTVVIFTSNHGTEFNDTKTNSWGSSTNYSRFQLQVPMIVHWPNTEANTYTHKTSHLDFSATLLEELVGVSSNPNEYSSGKNLFDKENRQWIIAGDRREIALITDRGTTVIDKFGNYKVYDANYRRLSDAKPKLSILMQGLSEQRRFFNEDD
ncbi:DUF3413 domain-containing protein [Vibrio sp. SCSIO 43136]|uniref:DUF3413 domain-containing protein n=1 Tax=Vibrio sp. SCSIO 43136 TaxID=2819101 RepID=UPI002074D4D3|nr:DUF3413 domain-containing protein [Vibrio sp. SCSIO 43136]USD66072.1 DUF3413 domain-containing protein [Vibrio sp. SCSIO 43136]